MAEESLKDVLERLNKPIPFAEFPKMLYHPDGRQATVNSSKEESELTGNGWCLLPAEALKTRAERDEADRKRELAAAAKAAKDKA